MPRAKRWYSKAAAAICALAGKSDPHEAIRYLVNELLKQTEITEPCPPMKMVASFRGVRDVVSCEMAQAGRLVPQDSGFLIQVNGRHSEEKRRFSCGHEICHTFFKQALNEVGSCLGADTGLYDIQQEEEYLCDVGAGHMLFHPAWLLPMARASKPSVESLRLIASQCGASIEAAALQLAYSGAWDCSFVFWEPGLRETERAVRASGMRSLFADTEVAVLSQEKLRVHRVYSADHMPFLPQKKSAGTDSQIHRAWLEQTRTEGHDVIDLGSGRTVKGFWESEYMPYYGEDGILRPRVVSYVVWDQPTRQKAVRRPQGTMPLFEIR